MDRRAVGLFNVAPDETELGIVYSFLTTLRLRHLVEVPIDAAGAAVIESCIVISDEIGRPSVALRVVIFVPRLRIDAA